MKQASTHTPAPPPPPELTQTGGGLPAEVHGVQAHGALGSPHVEPHGEAVGGVVVHGPVPLPLAVLQAPAEF